MKLDRNIEGNEGRGKYALLKIRELKRFDKSRPLARTEIGGHVAALNRAGVLDWGEAASESEFFLIRLKDKHAAAALAAYADDCAQDDPEFADEVRELASRAGPHSPFCKEPD